MASLVPPPAPGEPPFRWLFIDLNSYFASVEQQADPRLRGKPVAVAPILAETGACIAASYPAKKFGIKTGTRVREARRLCPGLVVVPARPALYVEYHQRIVEAVGSVAPIHAVRSIDEMSVRLDPSERGEEKAGRLALAVKAAIRERAGEALACSIGLSANEFLAKIATDLRKPDGLTFLPASELPARLLHLPLTDFPGVSTRMELRLHRRDIRTVEQMYAARPETLREVWGGILGERWYYLLRGYEVPLPPTRRRSLGHSHVLPPELRNLAGVRAVFLRLIQKASARMRAAKVRARALQVYVQGSARSWDAVARFDAASDPITLVEEFLKLWKARDFSGPHTLGVQFFDLVEERDHTPSLFAGPERRHDLGFMLDRINRKHGKNTVYLASGQAANDAAEEKIAFTKTTLFDEGPEKTKPRKIS